MIVKLLLHILRYIKITKFVNKNISKIKLNNFKTIINNKKENFYD